MNRNLMAAGPKLYIIQHARVMRIVARLRSDYPLLLFLPYFLTGQTAAFFLPVGESATFVAGIALAVLSKIVPKSLTKHLAAISIICCGAATMAFCLSAGPQTQMDTGTSYLAKVINRPRYKNPGGVEIALAISAKLKNDNGKDSIESLPSSVNTVCRGIDLPWRNTTNLLPGDIVGFKGSFRPIVKPINPFSYQATLFRHGYRMSCRLKYLALIYRPPTQFFDRVRLVITKRVKQLLGDVEISGLFLAMSIGNPDSITSTTEEAFKRTGLTHLLVVSGCQVTLVFLAVKIISRLLLSRILRSMKFPVSSACSCLGLACAIAFVELSGMGGSSLRAVFAVLSVVISLITERYLGMFHAILSSILLVSLVWPGAIFEPGIQLTYAALFGICLGRQTHVKTEWQLYLRICWSASLFTSLVVACWFGTFSITGFILNPLLAAPASMVTCNAGLLAIIAFVSGLDPWGIGLRICASILARMRNVIIWVSDFPLAGVEVSGSARLVVIGVLAILCARQIFNSLEKYCNERV